MGLWITAVIQGLRLTNLPTDPINWPESLGYLSLLIPALLVPLCRLQMKTLVAVIGCAGCTYAGYWFQFDADGNYAGYNIEIAWFTYALLACFCVFLDQYKMATIAAFMAIFGVVVSMVFGERLTSAPLLIVWAVLWALMFVPPLVGKHETQEREQCSPPKQHTPLVQHMDRAA